MISYINYFIDYFFLSTIEIDRFIENHLLNVVFAKKNTGLYTEFTGLNMDLVGLYTEFQLPVDQLKFILRPVNSV